MIPPATLPAKKNSGPAGSKPAINHCEPASLQLHHVADQCQSRPLGSGVELLSGQIALNSNINTTIYSLICHEIKISSSPDIHRNYGNSAGNVQSPGRGKSRQLGRESSSCCCWRESQSDSQRLETSGKAAEGSQRAVGVREACGTSCQEHGEPVLV